MLQSSLGKLSCFVVNNGNLLIACVKITAYNHHCSAPFSEPWSSYRYQVYSLERSRHCYRIKNSTRKPRPPVPALRICVWGTRDNRGEIFPLKDEQAGMELASPI